MPMNKERLIAYLKAIWPTVYKVLNGAIYFVFTLIRSMVKLAIQQIKGTF